MIETEITKGQEEILGGDGYIHYLDGGNGLMDLYIYQNLPSCIV